MSVTDALRAHHEQLQTLAADAEELAGYLDFNIDRDALRDLLVDEFRPDLSNGRGHLWLNTVVDDIARIVTGPIADDVRELAEEIGGAAFGVDVEEAARDAATTAEIERGFHCLDCDVNTIELGEYYMLEKPVWLEANPDEDGMLCIGCVEKRLGRRLGPDDFMSLEMNHWENKSSRLRARVQGIEEAPAA